MIELDLTELAEYNGHNGKPVYIAYEGKIYDVTESPLWNTGTHMFSHEAGKDLTDEIKAAPHGPETLQRYPQIGIVKPGLTSQTDISPGKSATTGVLSRLLAKYPFLKRHPHPMTVHFPIVFMFSASVFTLLYLITGVGAFEATVLISLGAGIFFTPIAMATGYFTWWLNYLARPIRPVRIKQTLSIVLFIIEAAAFVWRLLAPDVLQHATGAMVAYLVLVFSVFPIVTVIGWYGGTLTFPVQKR